MTNKVCNLSVLGSKQNHFLDIGFIFLISNWFVGGNYFSGKCMVVVKLCGGIIAN